MNLTGKWKGSFKYEDGYPSSIAGKSSPFELYIKDHEGIITGVCIDEIVKGKDGNTSNIQGVFDNNFISFIKTYKYAATVYEDLTKVYDSQYNNTELHYTGFLRKNWLTRKVHFTGEWIITTAVESMYGKQLFIGKGSWRMQKAK